MSNVGEVIKERRIAKGMSKRALAEKAGICYTMAEFTIFPAFRRKHFALDAAKMIIEKHPGKWEIKYNKKNDGAKKLWNVVAAPYEPDVHHLNEVETVLSFQAL